MTTIYDLKPVISYCPKFKHSDSMYLVRNLNPRSGIPASSANIDSFPKESNLNDRQEKLLKNLQSLQESLENFRSKLSSSKIVHKVCVSCQDEIPKKDWVIIADPRYPPYSLLWLPILWDSALKFSVHFHSTSLLSESCPNSSTNLFDQLECHMNSLCSASIRLIWKQVGKDPQLVVSPMKHKPIYGEINLVRLLNLIVSSPAKISGEIARTDELLDLCHRLLHYSNSNDLETILAQLELHLGKSQWFSQKQSPFTVDAVLWSVLLKLKNEVTLTAPLCKWMTNCNKYVGHNIMDVK